MKQKFVKGNEKPSVRRFPLANGFQWRRWTRQRYGMRFQSDVTKAKKFKWIAGLVQRSKKGTLNMKVILKDACHNIEVTLQRLTRKAGLKSGAPTWSEGSSNPLEVSQSRNSLLHVG